MKICIIGAGPAGLTAAVLLSRQLQNRIDSVDLFESRNHVGGLARSFSIWGRNVDVGPHRFFTRDERVSEFWHSFAGKTFVIKRQTRILYNNRFLDYPISLLQVFKAFGVVESTLIALSYLNAQLFFRKDQINNNFENWLIKRFGRRLYRLFFQAYSEKLWGLPCRDLDHHFAAQRIKGVNFTRILAHALGRKQDSKSLIDSFHYPQQGSGIVYENMKQEIEKNGGRIHFQHQVENILVSPTGKIIGLVVNGKTIEADIVISTMPLSHLLTGLHGVPLQIVNLAKKLTFRNSVIVYLKIDKSHIFSDQWIYIQDQNLTTGRITNYNNWNPELVSSGTTILSLEYWCNSDDNIWKLSDEDCGLLARKELKLLNLAGDENILDSMVVRIPNSYPVYFRNHRQVLSEIEQYLTKISGLLPIGRYGAYKYNNQDHSILMGMLAAQNILGNHLHELWSVNTDYDKYFET